LTPTSVQAPQQKRSPAALFFAQPQSRMNPGLLYAAGAFVCWGLFPLYFALLQQVPALEVVLHRSVWTTCTMLVLMALLHRWAWLQEAWKKPKQTALVGAGALLLAGNWLVYIYAVQTGRVVDSALGYFINPLMSVLLGVVVLGERLSRVQTVAVALAAAGVAWLTWHGGQVPWIALTLAASFALYGLLRKTSALGPIEGLALETLLLLPLALPALVWWTLVGPSPASLGGLLAAGHPGPGVLAQGNGALTGWLLLAGPITAVPLLLFAAAARRLPLATLGMMQYLSPTLGLLLGVWVFNEPFDRTKLVGFVLIWLALALLSAKALGALKWLDGPAKPARPPVAG
jgi:chloramphenicol-sensitive protein RarD